ncbi:hypothetical protein [Yoonia sp.]|uniref:hypothetical protein n=1 Tax=Yoonia sp. TaxID=2212373 RepID=UPI003F6D8289
MIYPLSGLIIGAILGAFRARLRGGKLTDMLQWGAAFAILFAVIGLFILIFIERSYV